MLAVLMDVGRSLAAAGLKKLVILNSHGGQPQVLDIAAQQLRRECGLLVFPLNGYRYWNAEKAFGAWQRGSPTRPELGAPSTTPARVVIVDKPGSPQTQLRVAAVGAERSSPDFRPLQVMNTVLGGSFSSRINMNLREEHGYTYGAQSQFTFRRAPGPFQIAAGIRTDVTAPAVAEVFKAPRHPYTMGLLKSMPRLGTSSEMKRTGAKLPAIPGMVPSLADLPAGCAFAPRCAFALDACRQAMPALSPVNDHHGSRCIRWQEISA